MDTRTTLPGPSGASHPAGTVANALTIAGSDPSGGAGVQADLKTFAAFGVYGTAVVTALTAQNTRGVDGVLPTPSEFVAAQLDSLLTDVRIDAVKVGMLGQGAVARVVADALRGALAGVPTVLDPVMVATSGDSLAADDVQAAITQLLPHVTVVTPNLPEAAA
uniref:bifunctional hydroxymethylpyrimidine kinase/phosphomethylpyrimidine kinase n=1 Tax=Kribbia dieselivorans TaxID=331526 RepID=UPI000ADDE205